MPKNLYNLWAGERCACGVPAAHKVEEVASPEAGNISRRPLSAFLCHVHFCELMALSMYEALSGDVKPKRASTADRAEVRSSNKTELTERTDHVASAAPMLVSIKDARKIMGLGNSTVYKLIASGDLTVVKIGGRTLIETATLRDLITKRRVVPKNGP